MKQKEEPPKPSEKNDKIDKLSEKEKSRKSYNKWVVTVIILSLLLSIVFTVITEVIYSNLESTVKLIVAIFLVLVIMIIAIVADMIGVATTSCDPEPFMAMASRKVRGAKRAVALCKNSDRVSSIFGDIVGDVCSIISGASGSTISFILLEQYTGNSQWVNIMISALVSAVIAAITIGGKAIFKRIALVKSVDIVLSLAKILSVFDKK